ncbi:MAG: TrbC/VirB2 family protein [Sphingorhabdus sp.]|nr:TrbC/VirB2 family protein [Sphingorhabdus sp.]
MWRTSCAARFNRLPKTTQSAIIWSVALLAAMLVMLANPDPAYAQNLESFASNVRGLLSSTLLRTLAVIAVIVTGLLWFTGRASTAVLVTVIIGIAIVFSADAIVGAIAG